MEDPKAGGDVVVLAAPNTEGAEVVVAPNTEGVEGDVADPNTEEAEALAVPNTEEGEIAAVPKEEADPKTEGADVVLDPKLDVDPNAGVEELTPPNTDGVVLEADAELAALADPKTEELETVGVDELVDGVPPNTDAGDPKPEELDVVAPNTEPLDTTEEPKTELAVVEVEALPNTEVTEEVDPSNTDAVAAVEKIELGVVELATVDVNPITDFASVDSEDDEVPNTDDLDPKIEADAPVPNTEEDEVFGVANTEDAADFGSEVKATGAVTEIDLTEADVAKVSVAMNTEGFDEEETVSTELDTTSELEVALGKLSNGEPSLDPEDEKIDADEAEETTVAACPNTDGATAVLLSGGVDDLDVTDPKGTVELSFGSSFTNEIPDEAVGFCKLDNEDLAEVISGVIVELPKLSEEVLLVESFDITGIEITVDTGRVDEKSFEELESPKPEIALVFETDPNENPLSGFMLAVTAAMSGDGVVPFETSDGGVLLDDEDL